MQTNRQEITNALPYMLAYPALLAGHQTINDAINDHLLSNYLEAFIEQDELPNEASATPTPFTEYINAVFSQFSDPVLNDPLARLCADGALKLPAYILPTLLNLLARNGDIHRIAFLLATYGHYLSEQLKAGQGDELEPDDWAKVSSDDVVALLSISSMATARLQTYSHFVAMYKSYRNQIATHGVDFLLRQMAYNRLAMQAA
jgi:mannitol-1-phosphate/altronate dehydrogenase